MESAGRRETRPPVRFEITHESQKQVKASSNPMPRVVNSPPAQQPTMPTNDTSGELPGDPTTPPPTQVEKMLMHLMSKVDQQSIHSRDRTDALQKYVDEVRKLVDTIHAKIKNKLGEQTDRLEKLDDRSDSMERQIKGHADEFIAQHRRMDEADQRMSEIAANQKKIEARINNSLHDMRTNAPKMMEGQHQINNPLTTMLNTDEQPSVTTGINPGNMSYHISSSMCGGTERFSEMVGEFSGIRKDLHPVKFLEQLDQYFQYHCMPGLQQVSLTQRRLNGDARVWFDSMMPTPNTYEEFKILFRGQFWSNATQQKIRNEIFRPFSYRQSYGLSTHAMY